MEEETPYCILLFYSSLHHKHKFVFLIIYLVSSIPAVRCIRKKKKKSIRFEFCIGNKHDIYSLIQSMYAEYQWYLRYHYAVEIACSVGVCHVWIMSLKSLLMKVKEKSEKVGLTQHSENEDHGIQSSHSMANRRGNSGNSVRLYFGGLQNHCRWWLQPWK